MASECVHPELIGFIAGCLLGSSLTKTGPGGLWYSGRAVNLWSWIWFLSCSLIFKMFSTMNFHYFIGTCHVYTFSSMCDCNSTFSFAQLTLKHFKACWKHSISKRLNPSFGNVKRKWGPQQPWQKLWKKKTAADLWLHPLHYEHPDQTGPCVWISFGRPPSLHSPTAALPPLFTAEVGGGGKAPTFWKCVLSQSGAEHHSSSGVRQRGGVGLNLLTFSSHRTSHFSSKSSSLLWSSTFLREVQEELEIGFNQRRMTESFFFYH